MEYAVYCKYKILQITYSLNPPDFTFCRYIWDGILDRTRTRASSHGDNLIRCPQLVLTWAVLQDTCSLVLILVLLPGLGLGLAVLWLLPRVRLPPYPLSAVLSKLRRFEQTKPQLSQVVWTQFGLVPVLVLVLVLSP